MDFFTFRLLQLLVFLHSNNTYDFFLNLGWVYRTYYKALTNELLVSLWLHSCPVSTLRLYLLTCMYMYTMYSRVSNYMLCTWSTIHSADLQVVMLCKFKYLFAFFICFFDFVNMFILLLVKYSFNFIPK